MVRLSWLLTLAAAKQLFYCPDNYSACEIGGTCCGRSSGDYACCPMANAVCCGDSEGHCCPAGYPICDTVHKRCKNHLDAAVPFESHETSSSGTDMAVLQTSPTEYWSQLLLGFSDGAGLSTSVRAAGACGYWGYSAAMNIREAVQYYSAHSSDFNLFYALQLLGVGLNHLSQAFYECTMVLTLPLDTLSNTYLEVVRQPEVLLSRIVLNWWKTGNLMEREFKGFRSATDPYTSGMHLGRVVHEVLRERKH